jgi:hypothetical protein
VPGSVVVCCHRFGWPCRFHIQDWSARWRISQPTKKLRVESCAERLASSLARLNHSCVQDALLEMGNVGWACANGCDISAEGLDMLAVVDLILVGGGGWYQLAIVLWLDDCLGVEPRIRLALAEGLCDTWGDHFGWRPPWSGVGWPWPFSFYPGIWLTTEKKHGNHQSVVTGKWP